MHWNEVVWDYNKNIRKPEQKQKSMISSSLNGWDVLETIFIIFQKPAKTNSVVIKKVINK